MVKRKDMNELEFRDTHHVMITEKDLVIENEESESNFIDTLYRSLFPNQSLARDIVDELVTKISSSHWEAVTEIVNSVVFEAVETSFEKSFMCPLCGLKLRDGYNLKMHKKNLHEGQILCKRCGEIMEGKYVYKNHIKTCRYCCKEPDCNKVFIRLDEFDRHQRYHKKLFLRMI